MGIFSRETHEKHKGKIIGGFLTLMAAGAFGLNQMETETKLPIEVTAKSNSKFSVKTPDFVGTFKGDESLVAKLETGKCYMMTIRGMSVSIMAGSNEFRVIKTNEAPCPS